MNLLFFIIRLPAFVIGTILLMMGGIVALDLAIVVGVFIVFIGIPFWLVILLPGSIILAAFSNDPQVIVSLFVWTRDEFVVPGWEWVREAVPGYFRSYAELGKWLIDPRRTAD